MIWEQEVEIVLMLTNVVENGRKKCEQYWPASTRKSFTCEDFVITAISVDIDDPYDTSMITTTLQIENLDTKERRIIQHVHYTAWPDHGVPSTNGFAKLIDAYKKLSVRKKDPSTPTLVHCSAGVGRTGVFLMVNVMLNMVS
jgi:protein tyrosine phosphatase